MRATLRIAAITDAETKERHCLACYERHIHDRHSTHQCSSKPQVHPEQVNHHYFPPQQEENGEVTGVYRCRECQRYYKQAVGQGYSNLMQHVRKHFESRMIALPCGRASSVLAWVSRKAQNCFSWIEWTIQSNLPYSFCEQRGTRKQGHPFTL